ncbi:hypothetical protein SADUNF_Sadunf01G0106600 [Salix dunnii]|uniref:SKP1-like protein n=1 Tax=Salix dunnii TaxID=1413687 RepID=A0A835NAP0_9ROSI|nr:hypothetical protein SADUNF_Sadunf01G0106600 [Salix dunnii]
MLHQYPGDGNKIVPSSQKTSTVRKSSDEKNIPSSTKIALKSSDGETFEVDEAVALKSRTIKRMIEETSSGNREVITLPIVSGSILAKVLQYCEKHTADGKSIGDQELRTWDADFVKLDKDTLFQLILAANYLGIERLVDVARDGAWSKVRPERDLDFCRIYGNDYNSDEDQEIEMGYQWVSESYSG